MNLNELGWNDFFENNFKEYRERGYSAGRVVAEHKHLYKIVTEKGELLAEISGKMRFEAVDKESLPAVGDWAAVSIREEEGRATIHSILPRKSKFSRKEAGNTTTEQILAANIDIAFLVTSLNNNFNVRRIERYLILAWESGANPVIVLSKADLCSDIEEKVKDMESAAQGVPIVVVSAVNNMGMMELKSYITAGSTAVLLGSSGVGKSTITNYLMGEEVQEVQEIRDIDSKGKHTSTFREMFMLPEGGLLIDTPGMRELQLWDGSEGISDTFQDIEALAEKCRFTDCKHDREPGCAIKDALKNGTISEERVNNYKRLQKEIIFLENKQRRLERMIEKRGRDNNKYEKRKNRTFGYKNVKTY